MTVFARTAWKPLLYSASALFVVITVLAMVQFAALVMRPHWAKMHRPSAVAKDAIYRPSRYGDRWLKCSYDAGLSIVRCKIWSESGRLLRDEEFLTYGGGTALRAEQIQIASGPVAIASVLAQGSRISHISLDDWVCLKTGRVLIAKSRGAETTHILNWLYSKAPDSVSLRHGVLEAQGYPTP